jgi:hypothetical protein
MVQEAFRAVCKAVAPIVQQRICCYSLHTRMPFGTTGKSNLRVVIIIIIVVVVVIIIIIIIINNINININIIIVV